MVHHLAPRAAAVGKKALLWFCGALLVAIGLLGPAVPLVQAACWFVFDGAPPLDFDAPRDGHVIVHIDVLGKLPPDIARIRVREVTSGATVWDVKPTTVRSECWNGCWNLTLRAGSNPASFAAGHQQFDTDVPQDPSFSLSRGTAYLFEVWDSKGRVERDRFTL
jgi:hypothetical protein